MVNELLPGSEKAEKKCGLLPTSPRGERSDRTCDAGKGAEVNQLGSALAKRAPHPNPLPARAGRGSREQPHPFKNSLALYSERNSSPASAKASAAPSSRSSMVSTSTISPPASRTASAAF